MRSLFAPSHHLRLVLTPVFLFMGVVSTEIVYIDVHHFANVVQVHIIFIVFFVAISHL